MQQKNNNHHSASYNCSSKQKIQLFGQIYLPQNLAQQQNGGCWEKTVLPTFETVFMRQLILYMKSSLTNFHVQNLSFSQFYRNWILILPIFCNNSELNFSKINGHGLYKQSKRRQFLTLKLGQFISRKICETEYFLELATLGEEKKKCSFYSSCNLSLMDSFQNDTNISPASFRALKRRFFFQITIDLHDLVQWSFILFFRKSPVFPTQSTKFSVAQILHEIIFTSREFCFMWNSALRNCKK